MKGKIRIYISGPVSRGVAESQMVNWAILLEQKGIFTRFVVFYNQNNRKKYDDMNISNMNADFTGIQYINYLFVREFSYFFHIRTLIKDAGKRNDITIQTRSAAFALPLYLLRCFYSFKLVYEIRGAGEELLKRKRTRDFQNRLNDRLMLKMSGKIITVSQKLLDFKIWNHGLENIRQKAMVIYGAADSALFCYDPQLRENMRTELGLSGKWVVLYVGMLDKEWQIPDVTFKLVADLQSKMKNLFFLVISPDKQIAQKYKMKYGISDADILIRESSQKELKGYINAADIGLLLREDTLINQVASPTKFAEYLLCGLPVLISRNVGDYSDFTEKYRTGVVIDLYRSIDHQISPEMMNNPGFFDRKIIAETGTKHFSKQHFLDALTSIY